jgi:hypothetical protein
MTTRRDFTQTTMMVLFASFLAAFSAEEVEAQIEDESVSDVDVLIRHRDQLRGMITGSPLIEGALTDDYFICQAVWNLDHGIMRRCPHDPSTYTREPDLDLDGLILEGAVVCPACRAKTFLANTKGYSGPLWPHTA